MTHSFLGKDIIPVFSAKDLGVILDSHLTYNDHIKNLVSSYVTNFRNIPRYTADSLETKIRCKSLSTEPPPDNDPFCTGLLIFGTVLTIILRKQDLCTISRN